MNQSAVVVVLRPGGDWRIACCPENMAGERGWNASVHGSACHVSKAQQRTSKCVLQYGLVHISVGDLLREQVADRTAAGLKAKDFMESGNLVPDEVVVEMIVAHLSQDDVKASWLLNGGLNGVTAKMH